MKRYSLFIFFFLIQLFAYSQYDVIIKNGRIIDGTGNSWYNADIAVKDGKIVFIGKMNSINAGKVIDANGLIVAPGFIDVHAHIENSVFEKPTADNYIYDGVTTVITGNCGGSADDLKKFFFQVDSMHTSINVASLYGHNTIRKLAMGLDNRPATPVELQKMQQLMEQGMKDGAVGLSTGLIYLPGMYANTDEVVSIAKVASRFNGVYASHIRNEENGVADAINEAISIGQQAIIPVEISHFKVGGKGNWGRSKETIAIIEEARKKGYDVTIDQYPYTASSTNLGVRLPDWALAGGQDSLKVRITNPVLHKQIVEEMLKQLKKYKFKNYSYAVVAQYSADSSYNGKSITDINILKGRKSNASNEAETILDMMMAGGAQMVYHSMNEDDVKYIMTYPFNMVGADAGIATGKGMPHPRTYGTNARILGKYVRDEKIISLEEAIRRMTSLAAQKFQLKGRGMLKEGMAADIVVFDEKEVHDNATFENPHQFSSGFKFILVNGQLVLDEGKHTGVKSGTALFGPAYVIQQ
ncbi:MAG: D-aminoacylase [Bacteroidota bacterium]